MQQPAGHLPISAVILAGGQGRRMGGQDKGLMLFKGRPLVEHLLEALQAADTQVNEILINANRNQAHYQQYGVPVTRDTFSDFQGPLAGFMSAMRSARNDYIMPLPCDGPRLPAHMPQRLYQALQDEQAELAVAHDGERLQPVHALIATALLPSLEAFLEQGERKIDRWYAQHKIAIVDFSDDAAAFHNINTPQDKQALEHGLP